MPNLYHVFKCYYSHQSHDFDFFPLSKTKCLCNSLLKCVSLISKYFR